MKIYVETSAALQWLLGQEHQHEVITVLSKAKYIVTSQLTVLEIHRAFSRLMKSGLLTKLQVNELTERFNEAKNSWGLRSITESILKRAGETFEVEPIRSLDAIHLATALEFQAHIPDIKILSFDNRILENAQSYGFTLVN